jgi:RNA polymerase sigma factor (sigma-70 family)
MVNRHEADTLSDEEILKRFRQDRDKEWIGQLFLRYSHLLFGVCLKYLKNPEDARDSLQQIFLKVLPDLNRFEIICFKAWIYQVARNYCLMELRRQAPVHLHHIGDNTVIEDPREFQAGRMQMKERKLELLEVAMKELPEAQRDCLTLCYLEKKSYQQISEMTGYSLMQVKSHIQNGKRKLKIMVDRSMNQPDDDNPF